MKLTILGATGATGACLTEQALAAGHEVTAVVRDPARLAVPAHRRLRTVISAVGPHGTGPTTVIQDSVRSIIQAMHKTGTRRLLEVSGSVVADEGESPYLRYLLKPVARCTFLRHICVDMRRGEDEIRHSDLDWTIFRPPSLTGKPASGTYRTAIDRNLPRGFSVSRADLAACMLQLLDDPTTVHRHVSIAG
jgi:putative NADH-flavin reductase